MGVLSQSVAFALSIALPHWIIRFDEKRLPAIQYARGWNTATHWSAIVAFSWLCVPVHFTKTRRNLKGFAVGVSFALGGLCVQAALLIALDAVVSALGAG